MKFEIGQQVWRPTFDSSMTYVVCPDCGGTGRLRVTFHDEIQVSIECQNCGPGYKPPTGRIKVYERRPRASLETIVGCEIEGEKIEWRTNECYRVEEGELFDNEEDCVVAAQAKAAQADAEERQRILTKEKPTRTWAWNAHYHRREIKEAQRRLKYHTEKLTVASLKAKEDKAASKENVDA